MGELTKGLQEQTLPALRQMRGDFTAIDQILADIFARNNQLVRSGPQDVQAIPASGVLERKLDSLTNQVTEIRDSVGTLTVGSGSASEGVSSFQQLVTDAVLAAIGATSQSGPGHTGVHQSLLTPLRNPAQEALRRRLRDMFF